MRYKSGVFQPSKNDHLGFGENLTTDMKFEYRKRFCF